MKSLVRIQKKKENLEAGLSPCPLLILLCPGITATWYVGSQTPETVRLTGGAAAVTPPAVCSYAARLWASLSPVHKMTLLLTCVSRACYIHALKRRMGSWVLVLHLLYLCKFKVHTWESGCWNHLPSSSKHKWWKHSSFPSQNFLSLSFPVTKEFINISL